LHVVMNIIKVDWSMIYDIIFSSSVSVFPYRKQTNILACFVQHSILVDFRDVQIIKLCWALSQEHWLHLIMLCVIFIAVESEFQTNKIY
jgi:hypothetical protein